MMSEEITRKPVYTIKRARKILQNVTDCSMQWHTPTESNIGEGRGEEIVCCVGGEVNTKYKLSSDAFFASFSLAESPPRDL